MIELVDVGKAYDGRSILEHISLRVQEGERVCVTGESGRGKTTLLRLVAGLEQPDSGEIRLPGDCRFSMVFQEDRLMEKLSAVGNVGLACAAPSQAIREELFRLGLKQPDAAVGTFSGGMKRRVALCRALLAPSDVILLDEPYKGLDDATRKSVIAECERLIGTRSALLVTHDLQEAEGWKIFSLK